MKIAVIGAPSSGKTTLITSLEKLLTENFHKTVVIKDYARDFVTQNDNKDFSLGEQYQLGRMSTAIEGINAKVQDILLSDFSTIITSFYTLRHGSGGVSLYDFAKIKGDAVTSFIIAVDFYDLIIFCDIMKEPTEELGRQFNKQQMIGIHKELLGFLYLLGITRLDKFVRLADMPHDKRIQMVIAEMQKRMVLTLWNAPTSSHNNTST